MPKKKKNSSTEKSKEKFPIHKIKINIIGIGGGAGSIISDIADTYKRTSFFVLDTDESALSKYSRKRRLKTIRFGKKATRGMGTGMNVKLGKKAAEQSIEKIKEELGEADLSIILTCLGGGTGSGAAPVVARICRESGSLVYGIFTLPFDFERERKLETAKLSLGRMRKEMDAISVIPNQRVFEVVDEKVPIKKALSSINETIGSSLAGLIDMTHSPGLINIDFADLETVFKKGKRSLSYLTRSRASGEGRVKRVLKDLMDNPLYPYDLKEAENIVFNIRGPNNLSLSEVEEISEAVAEENDGEKARIIFGVDLTRGKNRVDVTLLGVGCEMEDLFLDDFEEEDEEEEQEERKEEEQKKIEKVRVDARRRVQEQEEDEEEKERRNKEEEEKERRNALEVHKNLKEIEKELLKKEEEWESPAFLRKKKNSN